MEDKEHQRSRAVLALVADLIFAARIRGAAPPGVAVHTASRAQELKEEAGATVPRLVLVDLGARDDPVGFIGWVRREASLKGVQVVAFGSHVDVEGMNAARAAGADRVLARSAFVGMLPALLEERPLE